MTECTDKSGKGAGPLHRAARRLVAFARGGRSASLETTELRQLCSTKTLQMLGAMARAKGLERAAYIEMVLDAHAREGLKEASVHILSLSSNPTLQEAMGLLLETHGVRLESSDLPDSEEEVGHARSTAS